ncbi:exonuclease domain-containing protein [Dietzia maris]|uniref:Exonuclease domain-containing protein n=1 Tax=Dietzia maris TaxID=37915 RepID=A0AAE4R2U6_9ACTN|nr:exonuclease domain-containing protein [Dietzia maris]MDV6299976.1 exonuclease domain-containing protein [Dietzia maris]
MTSTVPHLIVVDVETSGLDPQHDVLEVAAIDLTTRQELYFVPKPINVGWLQDAHPGALKVNRYFERGVYAHELDFESTRKRWKALGEMLDGNILAGANPEFDARFVDAAMKFHDVECRRRYQLRDLATYAAGVLGTDPAEPTSSSEIFTALEVENQDAHSALGDARATAQAFNDLRAISLERK